MRYLLLTAAAAILSAALPVDAMAGGPNPDIQIVNNNNNNYIINDNFNAGPNVGRGDYGYRRDYGYDYRPYRYRSYSSRGFETHNEAVARIQAAHSRYRTNYHPRSYYNSPPHYYDW